MKSSFLIPLSLVIVSCLSFSCKDEETTYSCVDKMGNSYKTVVIGNQVWMAQNLENLKLSDKINLRNTADTKYWADRDFEQYSYYDNNPNYSNYGFLYNYKATLKEELIPDGWRLPTKADWEKLSDYIKAHPSYDSIYWVAKTLASKDNWTPSNVKGAIGYDRPTNDKYGFTIIPAGYRNELGAYYYEDKKTCFWTSTLDAVTSNPQVACFSYDGVGIEWINLDKKESGAYIRCVRDI